MLEQGQARANASGVGTGACIGGWCCSYAALALTGTVVGSSSSASSLRFL